MSQISNHHEIRKITDRSVGTSFIINQNLSIESIFKKNMEIYNEKHHKFCIFCIY